MITPDDVRALVAVMPQVTEHDHFGLPSFRVVDRGFATLTDGGSHAQLRLGEAQVQGLIDVQPDTFTELTEGAKVTGVEIDLERVPDEQFAELLRDAWRHRAPSEIADEI